MSRLLPGTAFQNSFLGEAAQRVQRALDLDGVVSPNFDGGTLIQPIILVGNGMDPGMSDRRNRRWMCRLFGGGGGTDCFLRLAGETQPQPAPIIVDSMVISTAAAAAAVVDIRIRFGMTTAGTNESALLDRTGGAIETVPGIVGGSVAPVGGAILGSINIGVGQVVTVPFSWMLSPGAALTFTCASGLHGWLMGRLF